MTSEKRVKVMPMKSSERNDSERVGRENAKEREGKKERIEKRECKSKSVKKLKIKERSVVRMRRGKKSENRTYV